MSGAQRRNNKRSALGRWHDQRYFLIHGSAAARFTDNSVHRAVVFVNGLKVQLNVTVYKLKEPTLNASNVSLITTSLNLLVPGRNGPQNMFLHHCQQSIQIERHRDDDRTSRIVRGAAQRFARCLTMERPSWQSNVLRIDGKNSCGSTMIDHQNYCSGDEPMLSWDR